MLYKKDGSVAARYRPIDRRKYEGFSLRNCRRYPANRSQGFERDLSPSWQCRRLSLTDQHRGACLIVALAFMRSGLRLAASATGSGSVRDVCGRARGVT